MAARASSATIPHDARTSVLAAVAERAYFSTARLADEIRVDPAQTDAIVHDLEAAGYIALDDQPAWALTTTGWLELHAARRRPAALTRLRATLRRPGSRRP